jgi:hypothetical protein
MAGTLSHSFTTSSANVNLTSLGAEDYAIFRSGQSLANVYRKTGGGSLITIAEYDPGGVFDLDEEPKSRTFDGTADATPTQSAPTDEVARVVSFSTTLAGGFEFTLPAGTGVRTAKIYVMAYSQGATPIGNLFCHLSDSSATDINANYTGSSSTDAYVVIDLSWNANSASQTLQVIWTVTATAGATVKAAQWGALWISPEAGGGTALTGQSITSGQGTLGASVSKALTGQAITSGQGNLGDVITKALSGQAITSGQGNLSDNIDKALSGQAVTASQGALVDNVAYALSGQQINVQQGSIAAAGDVTLALTGQTITASQGTLTVENDVIDQLGYWGNPKKKTKPVEYEVVEAPQEVIVVKAEPKVDLKALRLFEIQQALLLEQELARIQSINELKQDLLREYMMQEQVEQQMKQEEETIVLMMMTLLN